MVYTLVRRSLSSVLLSLSGDDSEEAWAIREQVLLGADNTIPPREIGPMIISTLGIDTPRAQKLRQKILELYKKGKLAKYQYNYDGFYMEVPGVLILSTIGLDSSEAQHLRDSLRDKTGPVRIFKHGKPCCYIKPFRVKII